MLQNEHPALQHRCPPITATLWLPPRVFPLRQRHGSVWHIIQQVIGCKSCLLLLSVTFSYVAGNGELASVVGELLSPYRNA